MYKYFSRIILFFKLLAMLFDLNSVSLSNILMQVRILYSSSLSVVVITAFFMGLVFSLQIVKEFLYLNAVNLAGSILALAFLRELSPVLTSVILIGKVGSYFTAELGTMAITEQIEILYVLGVNPIGYLVLPRVISFLILIPIFNLASFVTSLCSSCFICFLLYNIDSFTFFNSVLSVLSCVDLLKSCFKAFIFGFFISVISCLWGISTRGGSRGVGIATTSSVVTSLLVVCILDFFLSYYLFSSLESSLKKL
uniref:ABC transporter permease n=1 Tax=Caloglossa intermedia TaxID=100879 RepID=A0A1Z1M6J9_9FLOR|nr:hypothetical protein [Caloglossa intermedia]ARW61384.1 hypothetical protein [Caloglossa intermedia]